MQIFLNNINTFIKSLTSIAHDGAFILHGNSYNNMSIKSALSESGVRIVDYTAFGVNPKYEEVCKATQAFSQSNTDVIIAVGGGSTIDTAKYIKMKNPMVPLIAVPTTAGSGSESTSFAVYYRDGEKQSIMDNSIIPDYVLLMPTVLSSLPLTQKQSTLADALCQAIEAWWSVNATDESIDYSYHAIKKLLSNATGYFNNNPDTFDVIMEGSNYAGRAINIAKTTAAHAMSYKITSTFHLPHGYAVALCLPAVWEFMNKKILHGSTLEHTINNISAALGCKCTEKAPELLRNLFYSWNIVPPNDVTQEQIIELSSTINLERLKNFPVTIDAKESLTLYEKIFRRTL